MQRYELDAWLGDDHGLNEEQIAQLLRRAGEIEDQYRGADDTQAESDELVKALEDVRAG